jgi:predicted  nucleic acid-binding Zn-ribbon protein
LSSIKDILGVAVQPYSAQTIMALQPNMQILNNASRDFVSELEKFQNIPALAQGAEIIQALDAIRTRLDNFNTRFDNLDTRLGQIDTRLDQIENRVKAA